MGRDRVEPPLTVLVADDEPAVREVLSDLLGAVPGVRLVGQAADTDEAVRMAGELRPGVVLLDVRMRHTGGPAATRDILDTSPTTRVVALSAYSDVPTILEMLQAGAVGYVVKGAGHEEVMDAVSRAARGQADISIETLQALLGGSSQSGVTASRHLARAERIYRSALDQVGEAILISDAAGEILFANAPAHDLFGARTQHLAGRPVAQLLGDPPCTHGERRAGLGTRLDGSEIPYEASCRLASVGGGDVTVLVVREERPRGSRDEDPARRRQQMKALIRVQEEERKRIAADIHDDSLQIMAVATMRLGMLHDLLSDPEQQKAIEQTRESVQGTIRRLRHLLFELRPRALDLEGLVAGLEAYLEESLTDSGVEFVVLDSLAAEPPSEVRTVLYRIAQEALINVRKHAGASRVEVQVSDEDGGIRLLVRDDGRGFDPGSEVRPGHIGLMTIRERADSADGWTRVTSQPGAGTTVEAWVPLDA